MKILFLDFDGVITTYDSKWCIDTNKLILLNDIILKTDAKIVVSSTWKDCHNNVEDFKKSIYKTDSNKCSVLCQQAIYDNEAIFQRFISQIYDITKSDGLYKGDEIQKWLDLHVDEVDGYVIIDDDSEEINENQLCNFVQTDTYEGLTWREVKLCIARLNKKRIENPVRMNLELLMLWREKVKGLNSRIDEILDNYYKEVH